jgi:flagellar basal-body rod protein FlgC
MDALQSSIAAASAGLEAQAKRLRVAAENLANAQSTGATPGSDAYRRKTIAFATASDRETGATLVKVASIDTDSRPFELRFDPGNAAADAKGYVKYPNVNPLIELADMREANRSYESNLQVIKQARDLISMTIDLLRSNS